MARRTTFSAVEILLGGNYGELPDGTRPDLIPFIDAASAVVDDVAACGVRKGKPYSAARLELIERWLSAHYYTKMDPVYTTESTDKASGAYVRDADCPEPYKSGALNLDPLGCLAAILKGARASAFWLGKPPSQQTPAVDRS